MKTHGEYFIAPYGERSFVMELKIVGLTKKFGSKTAVDNLNITLTNGVYGLQEKQRLCVCSAISKILLPGKFC